MQEEDRSQSPSSLVAQGQTALIRLKSKHYQQGVLMMASWVLRLPDRACSALAQCSPPCAFVSFCSLTTVSREKACPAKELTPRHYVYPKNTKDKQRIRNAPTHNFISIDTTILVISELT